ncbi:MAG: ABC transporter ATP-binding protein [Bacteroidia bacterium]|nr:ABC transporter ATP-binding protein [Bacteroidia bacterium]
MTASLRNLFRTLDRYKWQYLVSALLLILSIVFRSFEPKILQIAIDGVISLNQETPLTDEIAKDGVSLLFYQFLPSFSVQNVSRLLLALAIMYVAISLFRGGFLFAADVIKSWCSEKVAKKMRDQAFAHIQQLPLSYFSKITRGELIQRCTGDIDTIKGFLKDQVIEIIRVAAIFGFSFWMMALVNLNYALISVSLTPLIGISAYWFFRKEKAIWRLHEAESDKLSDMVQENLNGIRLVAAFANEKYEIERFSKQNIRKRNIGFRHNNVHALFWPFSDLLGFIQIAVSIFVGGFFVVRGQITVGELVSFFTYIFMVAWPMRQLGRILSNMGMAVVAMERISEIMAEGQESQDGDQAAQIKGAISFRNVSFRYRKEEEPVLQQINFTIHPGEKVAIIGPTGAGKTSITRLLLRLFDPEEGIILLDGKPLSEYSRKSVRQKIGLALQKPFLFSTTIRKNIAYTQPQADEDQVTLVAGIAQVAEIRDIFPQGYETLVGEKGVTLSGGQKQRVALARTLLPGPDVLILDDITSAVDTETEQEIFKALRGILASKTTLIISHRITSIQQADRILVLDKGKVIQEGTPAELEKIPGYYREIFQVQSSLEEEISKL